MQMNAGLDLPQRQWVDVTFCEPFLVDGGAGGGAEGKEKGGGRKREGRKGKGEREGEKGKGEGEKGEG